MFQELIENRRSIRKYKDQEIPKEDLEQLVNAVFYAPTANNISDIEVILITDKEKIQEVRTFKGGGAKPLEGAQAAIAVLSDKEKSPACNRQDACIAASYILLMAEDLGIGACWINVNSSKSDDGKPATIRLHEILGVPEKYNIESVVSLGYPDEDPGKKVPRDQEGLVHYNKF